MSHYVAAGAVSGGLFRISLGLKGLIGGSVIGALLGLPVGILVSGFQSLVGENLREIKRRERRQLYEEKLQEWGARLQFTDSVLQEMEEADRKSAASEMEKITELLQRPQNSDWKPEE
ncbi:complex I assembly factor TIMMDC1, mitochondrial [Mantella aurantiaca]